MIIATCAGVTLYSVNSLPFNSIETLHSVREQYPVSADPSSFRLEHQNSPSGGCVRVQIQKCTSFDASCRPIKQIVAKTEDLNIQNPRDV